MPSSLTRRGFVSCLGAIGLSSVAVQTVEGQQTDPDADWEEFQYGHHNRGYNPEIDGISPVEGETLEHVWSPPVPLARGLRYTFPIVSDGYVISGGGPDHESLLALNPADGTEQWRYYMGAGLALAPAATAETVFAFDESGAVHAVDKTTGNKRWTRTLSGTAGFHYAPTVADGTIYVTEYNDSDERPRLVAINTDGEIQWSEPLADIEAHSGFPPTVVGDYIFVAFPTEGMAVVDTSGNSIDSDTQAFQDTNASEFVTPPAVTDERMFHSVGSLIVGTPLPGNESPEPWEFNTRGEVDAPVTVTENRVMATTENGTVYGLDHAGNRQWETSLADELPWCPVAAVSDTAYVPTGKKLFALDPADGSIRWQYEQGGDEFFGQTVVPTADGFYTAQGKFAPKTETPTRSLTSAESGETGPDTPEQRDNQESSAGSGPGFGVGGSVAAFLGSATLWWRSRVGDE